MNFYIDGVPFTPKTGKSYLNTNGKTYRCVAGMEEDETYGPECAWFVSDAGWCFKAMHCRKYPDGTIEWGYSADGHFINR